MKWLVQRRNDQKSQEVTGTFDQAVRFGRNYCRTNCACDILELPRNVRVATVDRNGLCWKAGNWFNTQDWLGRDHPEWTHMWSSLYALTGSYADENPETGERWQYTATYWKRRPAIEALLPVDLLVHEFRHRDRSPSCTPIAGVSRSHGRVVIQLSASHDYSGNWNHPIPEGTLV